MPGRINLNADIGEGIGPHGLDADAAIIDTVASVNVACGLHAGNPSLMHAVVSMAKARGVSIGAHPGFNDAWGFGRRAIEMPPAELESLLAYQVGALAGVAAAAGALVSHVKPHGALYNMAANRADYALAIGRAIKAVDRRLILLALAGSEMVTAGEALGLRVAREAFADRAYDDRGRLQPRSVAGSVIDDPGVAAARCVQMVKTGAILSADGRELPTAFESLCLHGEGPNAAAMARACRRALEAAGITVVALPDMLP